MTSLASATTHRSRLLEWALLAGLGGVFLANALAAALHPEDFERLVEDSTVGRLAGDAAWLVPVIGINDLALGLALFAAVWWTRHRAVLLAWAGLWLLCVSVIKLTALG